MIVDRRNRFFGFLGAMCVCGIASATTRNEPVTVDTARVGRAMIGFEETLTSDESDEVYVLRRGTLSLRITDAGFAVRTIEGEGVGYRFDGVAPDRYLDHGIALPGVIHRFIGNDPARWDRDIPHFESVAIRGLYPGVDLEFRATPSGFTYDFVAAPGADLELVRLRIEGARSVNCDALGALHVALERGELAPQRPVAFVTRSGVQSIGTAAASRFVRRTDDSIGIEVSDSGESAYRVFDPEVAYISYLGGGIGYLGAATGWDDVYHTLVASDGALIVIGVSNATDFLVTPGAYTIAPTGWSWDVFVQKYAPDGRTLLFSSHFGGAADNEVPYGAAIAPGDEIVIAGQVSAGDLPVTPGAIDSTFDYVNDGFVLRLSADGSTLVSSTYLGGNGSLDIAHAVAIDPAGNSVVVGETNSSDFLVTTDALKHSNPIYSDAFVSVVNRTATILVYSTYFGGNTAGERGYAVAVEPSGAICFGGDTGSPDFPVTPGVVEPFYSGQEDAFVAKLQPGGASLRYASYLGGGGWEFVTDMSVNSKGELIAVGEAQSGGLPTTPGSFDSTYNGNIDCFVSAFNSNGSALVFSGFFGGYDTDRYPAVALDVRDRIYLVGYSASPNLPWTADAFDGVFHGYYDAFLARISADGHGVDYATIVGGVDSPNLWDGIDWARAVVVRDDLAVFFGGFTNSPDFPVTANAMDTTLGYVDGFLARFDFCKGSFSNLGAGCPSPSVLSAPVLAGGGCAEPGLAIEIIVSGLPANAGGLLLLGLGSGAVPLKPNCALSIAPLAVAVPFTSSSAGTLGVPIAVPSTLGPGSAQLQVVVADPHVSGVAAVSNGLRVVIGP